MARSTLVLIACLISYAAHSEPEDFFVKDRLHNAKDATSTPEKRLISATDAYLGTVALGLCHYYANGTAEREHCLGAAVLLPEAAKLKTICEKAADRKADCESQAETAAKAFEEVKGQPSDNLSAQTQKVLSLIDQWKSGKIRHPAKTNR